jgi:transcriptional regulator with AAA-type ATPase domain
VFIFGEPGLEKDNIAALVHFGTRQHGPSMAGVDGSCLAADGAVLFGKGLKAGLLAALGPGDTLLITNVHRVRARAGCCCCAWLLL